MSFVLGGHELRLQGLQGDGLLLLSKPGLVLLLHVHGLCQYGDAAGLPGLLDLLGQEVGHRAGRSSLVPGQANRDARVRLGVCHLSGPRAVIDEVDTYDVALETWNACRAPVGVVGEVLVPGVVLSCSNGVRTVVSEHVVQLANG